MSGLELLISVSFLSQTTAETKACFNESNLNSNLRSHNQPCRIEAINQASWSQPPRLFIRSLSVRGLRHCAPLVRNGGVSGEGGYVFVMASIYIVFHNIRITIRLPATFEMFFFGVQNKQMKHEFWRSELLLGFLLFCKYNKYILLPQSNVYI